MSIPIPALIAARADACAWLRRQMEAFDRLHHECGTGTRPPLVTMRADKHAGSNGVSAGTEG